MQGLHVHVRMYACYISMHVLMRMDVQYVGLFNVIMRSGGSIGGAMGAIAPPLRSRNNFFHSGIFAKA